MNPLKKGPEIKLPKKLPEFRLPKKLPEVKAPRFLADIYADLRDRHLLPLVAVLGVAIVAVPIAFSESDSGGESTAGAAAPVAQPSATKSKTTTVVVARSTPSLRDYRDRLKHLTATDPFKQKYTHKAASEESATGTGNSGSSSGAGETVTTEGGGTTTTTTTHNVTYFTYEIDVRVVPVSTNGHPSDAEPTVRRGLPELTPLPGRKTPALIFMQPSADEQKALMLVNPNVQSIFGDGVCLSGGETCQLLALRKGLPETIVYGGNERIFRIELLDINVVKTDPPDASSGKSNNAG